MRQLSNRLGQPKPNFGFSGGLQPPLVSLNKENHLDEQGLSLKTVRAAQCPVLSNDKAHRVKNIEKNRTWNTIKRKQ
jgi:hypothetical protein